MSWTPLYYIAHILSDGRAVISTVWSMKSTEDATVGKDTVCSDPL